MTIIRVLVLIMLTAVVLRAQKYSNEFLTLPVGARAQAMGGSVIAGTADVYSTFLNPAGMAGIADSQEVQVGAMHAEWFAGVGKYDYLGACLPAFSGRRRLGFSLLRFGIDGIPNTLSLYNADGTFSYDNISEFSAADYAFLLSYAQPLQVERGRLNLGSSAKVIYREIGPFAKAWGFGLDVGLQYVLSSWQFGLVVKDITSTFNAWSFSFTENEKATLEGSGNEVPENSIEITKPQAILGAAWKKQWSKVGMLVEANATFSTDGQRNVLWSNQTFGMAPALGVEMDYQGFAFFRLGMSNLQKEASLDGSSWTVQPNLGVGFRLFSFAIDYAFTDIGDTSNQTYSHVISLRMSIKKK